MKAGREGRREGTKNEESMNEFMKGERLKDRGLSPA